MHRLTSEAHPGGRGAKSRDRKTHKLNPLIRTAGYLNNEFLESSSNRRTDAYGGSMENRFRIVAEVGDQGALCRTSHACAHARSHYLRPFPPSQNPLILTHFSLQNSPKTVDFG